MGTMASHIISLTIVYSTVYSDADQRKYQSSASLAFVRGNHRGPVNSLHKWPVTRKMFPFDDVIMICIFLALCWMRQGKQHYMSIMVSGSSDRILLATIGVFGHPLIPCYTNQPVAITRANRWQAPKHATACQNKIVITYPFRLLWQLYNITSKGLALGFQYL